MTIARSAVNRLFSPVFILLAGNILYAGCQWLLMSSLVRGESVSLLGSYSYSLSILAPAIAVGNLGLRSILARDFANEFDATDFLKLRWFCFVAAVGSLIAVLAIFSDDSQTLIVVSLVAFAKMAEGCSDICYGAMQKLNRAAAQGVSLTLRCISAACFFLGFWHATETVTSGFFGIALAWLLVLVVFDMPNAGIRTRDLLTSVSGSDLKRYAGVARQSIAIVITALVGSVLVAVPNFFIERILGLESLGYYASFFCFSVAMNLVGTSLGQGALAGLSRLHAVGNTAGFYKKVITDVALLIVMAGVALVVTAVWGETILLFAFGAKVSGMHSVLPAVIALSIPMFVAQYLSYAVTAIAAYSSISWITITALVVSVVLAFPLVTNFGITGAAAIVFVTGSIQVCGFVRKLIAAGGAKNAAKFADTKRLHGN